MSQYSNHLFTPGSKNNSWAHLYDLISLGDRVLDVGCSSGNFGEALIKLKNCEVVGLDLDENDIKLAKRKLNQAYVGDINDISFYSKLGKFDKIIFADVIEHLIDPRETLKKVKKLLKPNGKILFSIPHMAHSSVRLDLLAGKFPYRNRGLLDNTHIHFYDRDEFENVFNDAGYTFERIRPTIAKYPEKLIRDKLKKAKLLPMKNFNEFLSITGGNIFQFVGSAIPINGNKAIKKPEYIMPQDEVYELAQQVIAEKNQLLGEIKSLKNHIKQIETINENKLHKRVARKLKIKYPTQES